ncbi:GNAT family N-acetyltransferase [Pedobacter frigiditerrae]|uniref:GNAT family N-acetyltransferase n=1 Tax=Pedobacter frigiditerrae TaxID=2530452 RepID=A0A4R0MS23_9SPHI|nr:GNAT family N-acetyltransferase [Pedobacter frigiditerrae]TCC89427.1 GNAT family N-acetyltransferase [Pedobacter frigiditerrae]
MEISYKTDVTPSTSQIIELYESSGLPRPIHDVERIAAMYKNSDLIVTAWDGENLVGVSRTITDWVWSSYLADLAVSPNYKKSGIGKKLIEITRAKLGEQSMVLLLSVPTAMEYYPKVGFTKENRGFIIERSK